MNGKSVFHKNGYIQMSIPCKGIISMSLSCIHQHSTTPSKPNMTIITATTPFQYNTTKQPESELAGNHIITILFTTITHERLRIYTSSDNQYCIITSQDTPITRINASLLTRSIGSMVSIVGTVETASGNTATLHSSVIIFSRLFIHRTTNPFVFSVLTVSRIPLGMVIASC